ncbi:hypothetical protein BDY19DRAFT_948041 [Irpex rosettiformis]|uniref:Uncharacterized protein n=1 Tax=Irpex rosettiformis TaxID=378272 RepID=A0ACB8U2W4_9APHY|nr:hypothetical protein BDY19DRAFT_948041 [Irpex rosettiformis]
METSEVDSLTTSIMDNFPTELLLKTFSYLCTDKGQAGSVLSLVSRRFHDVSSRIRFDNIYLGSVQSMRLFLRMLEQKSSTPIVHHLFLYDNNGRNRGSDPITVCISIISFLAPSLVTLAGDLRAIKFTYGSLFLPVTSFPLLRDLSLACHSMISASSIPLPDMPNLHRVHKFGGLSYLENPFSINFITEQAPQLTHIRISNMQHVFNLPHIIDAALRHPDVPSKLYLPKGLKLLIIQGSIVGRYEMYTEIDFVKELQALANESHNGTLVVPDRGNYDVRDCETDWREVALQEGDGCWHTPPRQTLSELEEYESRRWVLEYPAPPDTFRARSMNDERRYPANPLDPF